MMILGILVTLLAAAAVTPGQTQPLATPAPVYAPATQPGMGYFLMQGNTIISPPFANVSDCYKALAKLKSTMQPGVNNVVCVHRRP
jgi:hypothetical protein